MLKRSVLNKLFLMRMIHASREIHGEARLQKLVFETEKRTRKKGSTQTFNYKFIRWYYGPYSRELSEDIGFLEKAGLVNKAYGHDSYTITKQGKEYLNRSSKIISQLFDEETMLETIDELLNSPLSTLLDKVYTDNGVSNYKLGEVIEDLKYVEVSV
ncbi:type II toxin-antitoxin system antitoxin SocA domain-containing protein [Bacillus cereus]|uniref:type II toxin-antitoxin system antitoxin SocA domain-containing protein n=1 Tax=Bacillus cereus TaxID=1396 RepID=UPI000BFDC7A5|nr:type II toxin-antitoxin system antitoxin SocA domain-containing protein [Bacillus cereus]PGQ52661.1 hypothetical protein COA22_21570 [Bacillus cereus]PGY40647.1 hypothetical protein COE10_19000 [Bacillus cereus]